MPFAGPSYRAAQSSSPSGLYLDKNQCVLIPGDQIHLTERTTVVPFDAAVAEGFDRLQGQILSQSSKAKSLLCQFSAPPERSTDEWEKARIS